MQQTELYLLLCTSYVHQIPVLLYRINIAKWHKEGVLTLIFSYFALNETKNWENAPPASMRFLKIMKN